MRKKGKITCEDEIRKEFWFLYAKLKKKKGTKTPRNALNFARNKLKGFIYKKIKKNEEEFSH